jgi:iron complex transport system substrate-binding protein
MQTAMFRRLLRIGACLVLIGLGSISAVSAAANAGKPGAETVDFADSAGRNLKVSRRIDRIYAAGPPAAIVLYTLAPGKLLGWNRRLRRAELEYIAEPFRELPELGRLTGRGNTANVEIVLQAKPDVIIDYGSIAGTYVSLADRVQEQTGLPYILLDGAFEKIPQTYRLLGRLIAQSPRAEQLAVYAERTQRDVDAVLARVPRQRRPRVYYGRGPEGLETGLGGSINVEVLERVGAVNVAAENGTHGGLATVSMEQIIKWNPEIVLTLDSEFFTSVKTNPLWRDIDAIKNKRVYLAPSVPFGWFDRPPSVNRLIGVKWLLAVLYPDAVTFDLRKETHDFYRLFYHLDLSEVQLDTLLERATDTRK